MNRTPIFERVEVEEAKLLNYPLSEIHSRGRHEARVFRSRLGLTVNDAAMLRQAPLDAATASDAPFHFKGADAHGQHLGLDFAWSTPVGSAIMAEH